MSMPFTGRYWTCKGRKGTTSTTLGQERPASPEHNSGNSEPHPIQQVSGPVRLAQVGRHEQRESVNNDFEMIVGNSENLNQDAAQNIRHTRIANGSTKHLSALIRGRSVRCNIENNKNSGIDQTIDGLEAFNELPTSPCCCCSIM